MIPTDLTPFLQVAFYVVMIIYAIFSAILYYHWQSFSLSGSATTQTFIAYSLVSIPLIAIMAVVAF